MSKKTRMCADCGKPKKYPNTKPKNKYRVNLCTACYHIRYEKAKVPNRFRGGETHGV